MHEINKFGFANTTIVMKKLATFFLTLISSFLSFAEGISDKEKEALLKLYYATNGEKWTHKWDLSQSVATWYGVKVESGKVIEVNLSENNLTGDIPAEIADLVNLEVLDLHKNHLVGQIPDSIEHLQKLQVLDISYNKISGELPENIGHLEELEILSLFDNEIEGELPSSFYTIKTLKVVLLNGNKLSGRLQASIKNMIDLENLSLFDNKMTGGIPAELETMSHLKEMNLSYNCFSGRVSKQLIALDALNMTMLDENGAVILLDVNLPPHDLFVSKN